MTWSRTIVNWTLDVVLAMSLLVAIWTAAIVEFVFPKGADGDWCRLWGWSRADWSRIHFGCLFLFALLALVHLMLHWSWVCGVVSQRLSRRLGRRVALADAEQTLVGVALLVGSLVVMGGLFVAALLALESPG